MKQASRILPSVLLAASIAACGGSDGESEDLIPDNTSDALDVYAQIVSQGYQDSLAAAEALDGALEAFVADPTEAKLKDARDAWLASREPYLQTEVFRFYDGPIDNPEDGPEGLLNAWPLDEAYIDYVEGMPDSGIVNSEETIDGPTLVGLNEQGGEANVATGYHAIEFLLWGQDQSDTGPGERPATDYVLGEEATAPNGDRRGEYLATVSDLLVADLTNLVDAWAPDAANYRADFLAETPEEGLRRVLTGMIVLSGFETGGERLQAALDSGDQEDEHSCFSDNTHRDMIQDVQGVKNVWEGKYGSINGTGIVDVVAARDADLAAAVTAKIDESLSLANALNTPFDQEIAQGNEAGRERVRALVQSLRDQEELLEDVFLLFELEVPVVE